LKDLELDLQLDLRLDLHCLRLVVEKLQLMLAGPWQDWTVVLKQYCLLR